MGASVITIDCCVFKYKSVELITSISSVHIFGEESVCDF